MSMCKVYRRREFYWKVKQTGVCMLRRAHTGVTVTLTLAVLSKQ